MKRQKNSMMMVLLALVMAVALGALALTGCGGSSSGGSKANDLKLVNSGKLTVLSDCDYPPFTTLDNGHAAGFEYDLCEAIAGKMGLQVNYLEPQKFDTIVTTIKSGGKADIGVSCFTINEERAKEIDFSDAYFDSNQGLVVMSDSGIEGADGLADKKVAAQSGTTGEEWANENISGAQIVPLDTATDCFEALQSGQVEGIVLDLPTAKSVIMQSFPDADVIQEVPTGEQYGIVVSKDNTALKDAINKALGEMKSDGTYQKIMDKYADYFG